MSEDNRNDAGDITIPKGIEEDLSRKYKGPITPDGTPIRAPVRETEDITPNLKTKPPIENNGYTPNNEDKITAESTSERFNYKEMLTSYIPSLKSAIIGGVVGAAILGGGYLWGNKTGDFEGFQRAYKKFPDYINSENEAIPFKYGKFTGSINNGIIEISQGKGKENRQESLVKVLGALNTLKSTTTCNPENIMNESGLYEAAERFSLRTTSKLEKELLQNYEKNYINGCYKGIETELTSKYKLVNILGD